MDETVAAGKSVTRGTFDEITRYLNRISVESKWVTAKKTRGASTGYSSSTVI